MAAFIDVAGGIAKRNVTIWNSSHKPRYLLETIVDLPAFEGILTLKERAPNAKAKLR